jgi:predicted  nucleic acid-binding Zn-ribbon protein
MAIDAASLRALHHLLGQLAELRDRLARGPRQLAIREQNVAARNADLQAAMEAEKQARLLVDRKQLDLRTSEQKIADWQVKLNQASSNKEFQALREQIAAGEMANSVLSDEILEGLERIDQLALKVKEAQSDLESTKQEMQRVAAQIEAAAAGLKQDIARYETELAAAERALPGELKEDYKRVVREKGADAMAEVEGMVCSGCGQQMTANMQSDLMLAKPVFCKVCGRLLYLPE